MQKITGCNFQCGPNLRIPLDPSFWLWWLILSWKSVLTTCHCINCENYAVSFVMKYCPISTTFRNHASVQHLLNLSCCDSFSVRSPYCCSRRFLLAKSSQSKKRFCLEHAQHEWATWFSSDNGLPRSVAKGLVLFAHLCDCSVKTELVCRTIMRKSLNRFQIGCRVYRQFYMSFGFESTSGQWTCSTENWTATLC